MCENIRIVVVSLFDVIKATICCFTTFRNDRLKIFFEIFFSEQLNTPAWSFAWLCPLLLLWLEPLPFQTYIGWF